MPEHLINPEDPVFSFTRFSSPGQEEGDSLRRQTAGAEAWCKRNGLRLDTTLTLHHVGSAFRGKHRSDIYALGQFLKLAQRGRIPKGAYLVLENLDRLSREEERPALRLWMDILDAGVNIVQLVPETVFRHEKSDMVDIMRAIIELSRGHSESRMKSERSLANWKERRRRAREDGVTLTRSLPDWIEIHGGERCVKPGAGATIKRIFELAAQGYGFTRIVRKLTGEGHTSFSRSGRWTQFYICKLLKDRRLLGEFQPRIRATGESDGEPIRDYFPVVVTEAEFYAGYSKASIRKCLRSDVAPVKLQTVEELHRQGNAVSEIARQLGASRQQIYRALVKLGRHEQPTEQSPRRVYLFGGMVRGLNRRPYRLESDPGKGKQVKILSLEDRSQSFPYFVFERALLHELREINAKEILDGANGHDEVAALEGECAAIDAEIQEINAFMEISGFSASLGKRVKALEDRQAEVVIRLDAARRKAANPLSATWGEAKTLLDALDSAPDQEDARVRLRAALRRIITSITMGVLKSGRQRIALVDVEFAGSHDGRFRSYTLWYRATTGNQYKLRPGSWAVVSAAGQGKPIEYTPSDEPGEPPIPTAADWALGLPVEPETWFPLPE